MSFLQSRFSITCLVIALLSVLGVVVITLAELDLLDKKRSTERFVCGELIKKLDEHKGAREVDLVVGQASSTLGNTVSCEIETVYIKNNKPLKALAKLTYGEGLVISYIY